MLIRLNRYTRLTIVQNDALSQQAPYGCVKHTGGGWRGELTASRLGFVQQVFDESLVLCPLLADFIALVDNEQSPHRLE